jgi:hypothetical protein
MKRIAKILLSALLIIIVSSVPTMQVKASPPVSVSFQFFYDNLSTYGTWVSYPGYGYAWIPSVGVGFRPYFSSGRWVYTDAGWMWLSYYDWGWAPFHYGSWAYDPYYGWLWVPGYDWAPAWVTWGYYGGYYGWAPYAPGISFSIGYHPPIDYWVFVPPRYVTASGWGGSYYIASNSRIVIDNQTTITSVKSIDVVEHVGTYNGKKYSAGPAKADFERVSKQKLDIATVKENSKLGKANLRGGEISVYRPDVSRGGGNGMKPSKVTPLEKIKRSDANRAPDSDKIKGREGDKKATPERKPEMKKEQPKQQERKPDVQRGQPKEQRKPDMKQPKQQERKPEMREDQKPKDPKTNPATRETPKQERKSTNVERQYPPPRQQPQQRESRPNKELQAPREIPKQNYQRPPQPRQPQQRERQNKNNPK